MHEQPDAAQYLQAMRPHQSDALSAAASALEQHDRIQLMMACGTGKTRLGPGLSLVCNKRTVIVYVPSLLLIRQTIPQWKSAPFVNGLRIMCVCSDHSCETDTDEMTFGPEDMLAELADSRITATTCPQEARAFLAGNGPETRVVFCTYQSSDVVSQACPTGFAFDLGIYDEAHRTTGCESAYLSPRPPACGRRKYSRHLCATAADR
jgi:predicted helicase